MECKPRSVGRLFHDLKKMRRKWNLLTDLIDVQRWKWMMVINWFSVNVANLKKQFKKKNDLMAFLIHHQENVKNMQENDVPTKGSDRWNLPVLFSGVGMISLLYDFSRKLS